MSFGFGVITVAFIGGPQPCGQGKIAILVIKHIDVVGPGRRWKGKRLPGNGLRRRQRQSKGEYRLQSVTFEAVTVGTIVKFNPLDRYATAR